MPAAAALPLQAADVLHAKRVGHLEALPAAAAVCQIAPAARHAHLTVHPEQQGQLAGGDSQRSSSWASRKVACRVRARLASAASGLIEDSGTWCRSPPNAWSQNSAYSRVCSVISCHIESTAIERHRSLALGWRAASRNHCRVAASTFRTFSGVMASWVKANR